MGRCYANGLLGKIRTMKFILLLSVMLLTGCASIKHDAQPHGAVITLDSQATSQNLTSYAQSLVGTPYKYGGNSPDSGFDCSGFVGHVFRQSVNINLPRSSIEMFRLGQPVETEQLQPGDLVFYNTLRRAFSHVGIYLGDDRFVHSPSSGGSVRVENMQMDYWRKHFNGARRVSLNP